MFGVFSYPMIGYYSIYTLTEKGEILFIEGPPRSSLMENERRHGYFTLELVIPIRNLQLFRKIPSIGGETIPYPVGPVLDYLDDRIVTWGTPMAAARIGPRGDCLVRIHPEAHLLYAYLWNEGRYHPTDQKNFRLSPLSTRQAETPKASILVPSYLVQGILGTELFIGTIRFFGHPFSS
jgi:hypothetical protein